MTVLQNLVAGPDGTPLDGWLDVELVGNPFQAASQTELLGPLKDHPIAAGVWSVDLAPALYQVTQRRKDGLFHSRWTVDVPVSDAPVWLADCLVTVPGTPVPVPLLGIAAVGVDVAGHLLVTYTDGTTIDAGMVQGPPGDPDDGFLPFWVAGETVTAGAIRVAPTGETIRRDADGVTRPTFDATEADLWTVVSAAAVVFGSTAGTAVEGNDPRVTPDQPDATASIRTLGSAAQQAKPGDWLPASEEVSVAATGIAATNVRDALLELLGLADDAGDVWSSTTKALSVTAGTYVADSDLNVAIAAGQAVWLDYFCTFSGPTSATANLRARLDGPVGATAEWASALDWAAPGSETAPKGALAALGATKTFSLNGGVTGIHIRAKVVNGSTAGTLVINWSPDLTTASAVVRSAWGRVTFSKASSA